VFENRVLRIIFGLKREVIGGWRKLHNEEFHNFHSSPSIIRTMKSRRIRWSGQVAQMRIRGMYIGCCEESQKDSTRKTKIEVGG
jgi:hypothetical protein